MIRKTLMHSAALALAIVAHATPAAAQTMVSTPNPDADRLAQTMRTLAASPRDLSALVEAGRLSTRLNDMSAALAFFQRAESVSPGDPRIAAGRAAVLVRMKRPGEALRLFQSAESRGAAIREYAADRGFAYDLMGQPGLAQADYKIAMQRERDDELVRRYALSLGISGQAEEANALLDPLLRRSDRAAWRARAFILAMNGDIAGAEKIAASMMGAMGPALVPFFRRLTGLAPADRAFAVHFGELSPTQARLADARLAPVLPAYVPDRRPVQVAAVRQPAAAAAPGRARDRRSARDRRREQPVQVAAASSLPRTAAPVFAQQRTPVVQPLPTPAPAPAAPVAATQPVVPAPGPVFAQQRTPIVQPLPAPAASAPVSVAQPLTASPAPVVVQAATPAPAPVAVASAGTAASGTPQPPVSAVVSPEPQPAPVQLAEVAPREVAVAAASPAPAPAPPGPAAVGQEDSVLASIVANLTIPAAELEAANSMALPAPEPSPVVAPPPVAKAPEPEPAKPAPVRKPEVAKAEKPVAAKSTKAAKAVDAKGKLDAKAKAEPKAKPDPERVWVQVAGGANAADLAKAWKNVTGKAPAQFKGKEGWWTPVRASNRLLTGPFKTQAEGQSFVNALAKAGVSGFVFTSEAGQKISKIGAK